MREILSPRERDELAGVIAEVEQGTAGEIRLILVRRSLGRSHVTRVLWLAAVSLGLLVEQVFHLEYLGEWDLGVLVLLATLMSLALARWPAFERRLISAEERRRAVWQRAELEFYREGLTRTAGATGILLMLSLFERQAVVLADRAIAERLPKSTWDDVVGLIVRGARSRTLSRELAAALRLCGEHLAKEFPARPGDGNELPNTVLIKD